MANQGAIRAGQAFVELFADDSKLVRGLKAASAKLKTWGDAVSSAGKGLLGLGVGSLGGLLAATKITADMGGALTDMAARTGIGVEALQELQYAAKMTGASGEDLEAGIRKMQRSIAEAAEGSDTAIAALGALGLTVQDLSSKSPDEQMRRIADGLAAIRDPGLRAAAAMEIFGKSGTKLLPMMAEGAAGLDRMMAKARELGLVLSAEDVAAADNFGDTLDTLWQSLKVGLAQIGIALMPMLTDFANRAMEIARDVGAWVRANQGLIVSGFKLAAAIAAGGLALLGFGKLLGLVSVAMTVFSVSAGAVHAALGLVAGGLGLLISPIGLVVAAVAGLGGWFLYASGQAQNAVASIGGAFSQVKRDVVAAWDGIAAALGSGRFDLAAKLLWATLKLEFTRGVNWLAELWTQATETFRTVWDPIALWFAKFWAAPFRQLQELWIKTCFTMEMIWEEMWNKIGEWWHKAYSKIAVGIGTMLEKLGLVEAGFTESLTGDLKRDEGQYKKEREGRRDAALAAAVAVEREWLDQLDKKDPNAKRATDKIDADAEAAKKERAAGRQASAEAAAAALAAAQGEFADAQKRAQAADIIGRVTWRNQGGGPGQPAEAKDFTGAGAKTSVAGTFSAYGAWGMGTDAVNTRLERIIAATEGTRDAVKRRQRERWGA